MTVAKIDLPEQMELIRQGSQIEIVRKWFDPQFIALGVIGAGVSLFAIVGALSKHGSLESAFDALMKYRPEAIFYLVFACAGIWMMYSCVARLINRTYVTIGSDSISVRHSPLPWLGNTKQDAASLKQIYIKTTTLKFGSRHKLQAMLKNGSIITLVDGPGLSSMQASYIQQALEQSFRIDDAAPDTAAIAEAGMTIRRGVANLEIVKRWYNDRTIGMTVVSVIWLAISGSLAWGWLTRLGALPLWPINTDIDIVPLLIGSTFLIIGVLSFYRSVAEWLNQTHLTVTHQILSVRHGPLPWLGNLTMAISKIKELQLRKSKFGRGDGTARRLIHAFELHAVLTEGQSRKLIGGFADSGQVRQLKQEIEGFLARAGVQLEPPSEPANMARSRRIHSVVARLMALFFGLLGTAGGVFLLVTIVELNEAGATTMSQVVRGVVAGFPLSIGLNFLAVAYGRLSDRAVIILFCLPFVFGVLMFALLAIHGAKPVYASNRAAMVATPTIPAGAQVTPVTPGRIFKDCDSCPEMVEIPAGSFRMGSNREQQQRPAHNVTIAKSFALGKTETTQGQWRAVMGTNPSYFPNCGDNCPVERVHWQDALEYVRKLSEITGQKYRLPSESEWEYACRAGGTYLYCGSDNKDDVAFNEQRDGWKTRPVAGKQANAFGLYDMSGSVWEWTADCWHDDYSGAPNDGTAWTTGDSCFYGSRVVRSGSWFSGPRPVTERKRAGNLQEWNSGKSVARDQGAHGLRPLRELK